MLDYKCDLCKGSKTYNSTSELRNHRKECHASAHPSYLYTDGIANEPTVYNNTAQAICQQQKTVSPQIIVEPQRFVNTAGGSYTIPHIEPTPPTKVLKVSTIDARKIKFSSRFWFWILITFQNLFSCKNTAFKCGVCDESVLFKTTIGLRKHLKEIHGRTLQYECYICKIKFPRFADAKQHYRLHVLARSEECQVCDELWTPKEFNRHLCAREKSIQCEYCTKSFRAMFKLIRHIDTEHATEKVHHRCSKCNRYFGMGILKDLHEMQHKEVPKNHICEICSKAFSSNYLYECHRERSHSTTSNALIFSIFCSINFLLFTFFWFLISVQEITCAVNVESDFLQPIS